MQTDVNLIIAGLEAVTEQWIQSRKEMLEFYDYSDVVKRDFFFHIVGTHKPVGDYVIRAIDHDLFLLDQEFLATHLLPRIVYIILEACGGFPQSPCCENVNYEFILNKQRYLVVMKIPEATQWDLEDIFDSAKAKLQTEFVAVVGSYFGEAIYSDHKHYRYFSGKRFWSLISEEVNMADTVYQVLSQISQRVRIELADEYSKTVNRVSRDTVLHYCNQRGEILWENTLYS